MQKQWSSKKPYMSATCRLRDEKRKRAKKEESLKCQMLGACVRDRIFEHRFCETEVIIVAVLVALYCTF